MTYEIITKNVEETTAFAVHLSGHLMPGDVIALEGDLGAGKTAFTKGIAKGLGITRNVNSPTFTIIKEYKGRLPLYHMDVYRMEDEEEDLGFDEYFMGEGVSIVEWAHLIENQLPVEILHIHIYHHENNSRRLVFSPAGKRYEDLCKEIFK
ncbi:tRNA (adenosine(37)-N6)-threonylcarbamoyltransferase complex ATPase subunit type 1 TsaE [Peribacillus deserti]|uniref:tRNA threonylcarbamoyladenosine biosynthesis protein TsaE n=1 Tax=Peribacillus deserti TaxID=673318 RepID=A0A2N5MAQ6_9BACI|nr:tRNA (adenosine(37)-N6)-threonylcarbamoyltransferase complex ATPase subunit type 1 TsaE [Peribacillus deserti]PLT31430.1 tRNA (adenosine(37)-N6)-threonylcarbamoyltransferase complex ATPase subunit type 1 TsaE [Peribacillus deserti]